MLNKYSCAAKSYFTGAPSDRLGQQRTFMGGFLKPAPAVPARSSVVMMAGQGDINVFRQKVGQAKNSERITGAMRLVAAAKVRRATQAVLAGRPFVETLASVLYTLREKLGADI